PGRIPAPAGAGPAAAVLAAQLRAGAAPPRADLARAAAERAVPVGAIQATPARESPALAATTGPVTPVRAPAVREAMSAREARVLPRPLRRRVCPEPGATPCPAPHSRRPLLAPIRSAPTGLAPSRRGPTAGPPPVLAPGPTSRPTPTTSPTHRTPPRSDGLSSAPAPSAGPAPSTRPAVVAPGPADAPSAGTAQTSAAPAPAVTPGDIPVVEDEGRDSLPEGEPRTHGQAALKR